MNSCYGRIKRMDLKTGIHVSIIKERAIEDCEAEDGST